MTDSEQRDETGGKTRGWYDGFKQADYIRSWYGAPHLTDEQAARLSDGLRRYRMTNDGTMAADPDGRITWVDDAAHRIASLEAEKHEAINLLADAEHRAGKAEAERDELRLAAMADEQEHDDG